MQSFVSRVAPLRAFRANVCARRPWLDAQPVSGQLRAFHLGSCRGATVLCAEADATAFATTDSLAGDIETCAKAKWAADGLSFPAEQTSDLASLGLGGFSPVGVIQKSIEALHTYIGLPWWAAIMASTVALRSLLLPLVARLQSNSIRLSNIRPETERLTAKAKEHSQAGNDHLAARVNVKLYSLYHKHGCNPYKALLMPFLQVPLFICFFVAIRRMAALPVESMKTGGALWFTDLTAPDQYFILPGLACLSFLVIMELGGETGVTNPSAEKMKTFFRAFSVVLIPVTASLPSGLFVYWMTSSGFSVGQILLLKVPRVRAAFNIPEAVTHPSTVHSSGFFSSLKEGFNSAMLVDQAKRRNVKKRKKQKEPKLYAHPPSRRT